MRRSCCMREGGARGRGKGEFSLIGPRPTLGTGPPSFTYFAREEGRGAGFGRRWPSSGAQNKNKPTFSTCYLVCQLSLTGDGRLRPSLQQRLPGAELFHRGPDVTQRPAGPEKRSGDAVSGSDQRREVARSPRRAPTRCGHNHIVLAPARSM